MNFTFILAEKKHLPNFLADSLKAFGITDTYLIIENRMAYGARREFCLLSRGHSIPADELFLDG